MFLRNSGVSEIRLLRLINHGVAKENWDDIGLSKDEQLEVIKRIKTTLDSKITLGGFLELKPCQYLTSERKCLAGKNKLYIDNKGDIYPCGAIKSNIMARIGNINNDFDSHSYDKKIYSCMAY
jgi:MoaA/NifB/PqqE/SkfB family radical SAM enzyme